MTRPRLGLVAERLNPISRLVLPRLEALGIDVDVLDTGAGRWHLTDLRPEHDAYALKSTSSERAMTVAGALHAAGAVTVDPYPNVAATLNKAVVSSVLSAAGLPVPATHVAAHPQQLVALLEDGPVVVKPYRGHRGVGVEVVHDAAALIAAAPPGEPALVQRWHPGDGFDRKLYVIGDQVFGVRRRFPLDRYREKAGAPFTPDADLAAIARAAAAALGLGLLGIDVVISGGQPWVVDAGSYGSFMGVAEAPELLARHLAAATVAARDGQLAAVGA